MRTTALCIVAVTAGVLAGCGSDFDPYNQLDGLRVLAVRASPPALPPGESTVLDALVYAPEAAPVAHAWSWCPLRAGAYEPGGCAISAAELQAELARAGLEVEVDYDLGTGPTARLEHAGAAAVLAELCTLQGHPDAPPFVAAVDCRHGFPVSVQLVATAAAEEIRVLKSVYLLPEGAGPANRNPELGEVFLGADGAPRAQAVRLVEDLPEVAVTRGLEYELFVEVPEASAERYLAPPDAVTQAPHEVVESLRLTWFVEAGETGSMRTSYIDGEIGFDALGHNTWRVPHAAEDDAPRHLFHFVLRDDRGGVAWTTRVVSVDP